MSFRASCVGSFENFRDLQIAAPLKPASGDALMRKPFHFRDLQIAAPLKLVPRGGSGERTADFRDLQIAAPLKQGEDRGLECDLPRFPRSSDRGPIEAAAAQL